MSDLLNRDAMKEWRRWVEKGHGVIVYTTHGKFGAVLTKTVVDFLALIRKNRETVLLREPMIGVAERQLQDTDIRSNDRHVLELALAGRARVLCTNDGDLVADFRDAQILPRIDGKARAVYPHNAEGRMRRLFLDRRRCRKRAR